MRQLASPETDKTFFTTQELILALRNGNERAILFLYDYYAPALLGVIIKIIGDKNEAEDLLQNVFVKVWLHISSYEEAKGRFYTWLINLTRNEAIDLLRSKNYKHLQKQQALYTGMEYTLIGKTGYVKQDHFDLYRFVARLPKLEKDILELAFYQGFSCKQIAKALHMPEGSVKTCMQRSYKKLKPMLS